MEHKSDEILASIKQFDIPGWTKLTPEQIKITTIQGGCVNTTLKVEKVPGDSNNNGDEKDANFSSGPSILLIKKYGGSLFSEEVKSTVNPPLIQSLIFYEQSVRGWGPKLYGLLENGRVEEYIDCHTLTAEEAFQPEFIKDLAKAYARFHSLKLPIKQESFDTFINSIQFVAKHRKKADDLLTSGQIEDQELLGCVKRLSEFPVEDDIRWLTSFHTKVKQRVVLCTMDPNYFNRLVRNQQPSDPDATRVIIIDFDASAYAGRGFDLGGHFIHRIFNSLKKDTKWASWIYPNESERIAFLSAYLEEAEKLFDDFDRSSLDSLENLVLETDFSALIFAITLTTFSFSVLEKEPKMGFFVDPILALYKQLKQQFCATHGHLLTN